MSKDKGTPPEGAATSPNDTSASSQDGPECFVIMPMSDPEGYKPGHFRRVYEDLFIPACEAAGYRARRADEVRQTNLIHLDVLQRIIDSPMALCDLSSRNPNVLFELGLRQAFDKPVVLVQEVGTPPIFDITPLRYATYRNGMYYREVVEDRDEIAQAILETQQAIGNQKNVNSIVRLLSLTRHASLATISEGEKEPAMLQLIMVELGSLRTEVRTLQSTKDESHEIKSKDLPQEQDIDVALELELLAPYIDKIRALYGEVRKTGHRSSELDSLTAEVTAHLNRLHSYTQRRHLTQTSVYPRIVEAKRLMYEASFYNGTFKPKPQEGNKTESDS